MTVPVVVFAVAIVIMTWEMRQAGRWPRVAGWWTRALLYGERGNAEISRSAGAGAREGPRAEYGSSVNDRAVRGDQVAGRRRSHLT